MEVYLGNLALASALFLRTRRNLLESVNLTGDEPAGGLAPSITVFEDPASLC